MSSSGTSLIGRTVDRYEVISQLGQGGFGAVYRARHTVIGSEVALKVLWPDHASNPKNVERFLREARAAATLGSEHIARVIDASTTPDGIVFLAMELLEGRDLEEELRVRGTLPVGEAVGITLEVLEALEGAHARGIVHRDLKPANVFIERLPDGRLRAKLLDFGISKFLGSTSLTGTGAVLGTPRYMSPEQIEGARDVDGRADLYAVGVMLYELLSGRSPFEGSGYDLLVRRARGEVGPPLRSVAPNVPEPVAQVVARALTPDRDARWPHARAMAEALRGALEGRAPALAAEGVVTAPPGHYSDGPSTGPLAGSPEWLEKLGVSNTVAVPSTPQPLAGTALMPSSPPGAPTPHPSVPQVATPHPMQGPSSPSWSAASSTPGSRPGPAMPTPTRTPQPSLTTAQPARTSPLVWVGLGGLALVLALGIGVLAVLLVRVAAREERRPGPTVATPAAPIVAPAPSAPPGAAPFPPTPTPQPTPQPTPPTVPPPTADPAAVRYVITSYVGAGPRNEIQAVLERARPEVARCARPGQSTHVAIDFIATFTGAITIANPADDRPSDDASVASCVTGAVQSAGPARFAGMQTAIVELDVDVPPG